MFAVTRNTVSTGSWIENDPFWARANSLAPPGPKNCTVALSGRAVPFTVRSDPATRTDRFSMEMAGVIVPLALTVTFVRPV